MHNFVAQINGEAYILSVVLYSKSKVMSTNSSKIIFCATFLVLVTCVQYLCALFVSYTSVVEVTEGKLRGTRGLNGQNRYYGIPYATSKRFQVSVVIFIYTRTFCIATGKYLQVYFVYIY